MSNALKTNICGVQVVESVINLNDHRPLVCSFKNLDINLLHNHDCTGSKLRAENLRRYCWRWDKSDLSLYYDASLNLLNNIAVPDCINCESGCNSQKHRDSINTYYGNIVAALQEASYGSVHRVASNSLKPFWNDVLEDVKVSICLHDLWLSAGRPASGELHNIKC